ncbi:hypothetical protein CCR97_29305 [Rhodoplanes elegans]|uniref:Glycerophosphoryl diester phosphodiesterase membrane domain-containing protein n=1 Tax=Rhodoplanes elegans TaxID=29408 RepID=A0A327KMF0_9BRAD|nr:DUF6159 family protein [Rhodoplanes elegans]MBK5962256.1 hypothetical protein [Rhodoplanes elegans]RAI38472.1 hypothetical protein CH338_12590 [Rhodoplanes elegans]
MRMSADFNNTWIDRRLATGFAMAKAGVALLRARPALLLLPISAILGIVIFWAVVVPLVFALSFGYEGDRDWIGMTLRLGVGALGYLLSAFLVVFCHAALIVCARGDLEGRPVSLGAGLAAAARRWPQILAWSAFAATIGLVLRVVASLFRDDGGLVGWVLSLLIGSIQLAFAAAVYFVVPVVVVEGVGPFTAVRRSFTMIRERWGEVFVLQGGVGLVVMLVFGPIVVAFFAAGVWAIDLGLAPAVEPIVVSGFLILAAVAFVIGVIAYLALDGVFAAAAYAYATSGTAPAALGPDVMPALFRPKKPGPAAPTTR